LSWQCSQLSSIVNRYNNNKWNFQVPYKPYLARIFSLIGLCFQVVGASADKLEDPNVVAMTVVLESLTSPSGAALVVPVGATAAALNVTAVSPDGAGFVTVWPCSVDRPLASSLNFSSGDVIPNGVVAPLSSSGSVCFYSSSRTDLVIDIAGWFSGSTFNGATPQRLVDSRNGTGVTAIGPVSPSSPIEISIAGINVTSSAGVSTVIPANLVAASLNVTAVNPSGSGFVTVWPCDASRPLSSNLNFTAGSVVANGVIAPVSSDGRVCLYSSTNSDIVVDIAGWFEGTEFRGATPLRLTDTRDGTGGTMGRISPSDELRISVAGAVLSVAGTQETVPQSATSAALNVTVVDPSGAGFLTVWPCGVERPLASNLNYVQGDVIANNVIASIGASGDICVYSSSPTHVVVDIAGYFSGMSQDFVGTTPKRLVDTRSNLGAGPSAFTDSDSDGVVDVLDAFPMDPNETLDTDSDGTGNNADTDDDGDGIPDATDPNPLVPATPTAAVANNLALTVNLLPNTKTTQNGTLTGSSSANQTLTFSLVSQGASGVATITDSATGTFTYETLDPTTTAGSDSFTFKVNDGQSDSANATVSVSINTDPLYQHQWFLDNTGQKAFALNGGVVGEDINVDTVIASGLSGKGVIVAVLDEGLEIAHEDLVDNVIAGGSFNYVDSSTDPTNPSTIGDHGTSVAGLVAARGWNNKGGRGVAPLASLKGFNVLKATTTAQDIESLGGAAYSADVAIFNRSLGSDVISSPIAISSIIEDQFKAGVTNLRGGKGAIYVQSGGNGFQSYMDGSGTAADCSAANAIKISCQSVAGDQDMVIPQNIAVAALAADGKAASYSTAGAANWISGTGGEDAFDFEDPDFLSTPAMITTDQSGCNKGYVRQGNEDFANAGFEQVANNVGPTPNSECKYTSSFNGTSSAAPVVTGVIALILEANPALDWRDVKHVLQRTARQVDANISALTVNLSDGAYVAEPAWATNAAGVKFHNRYGFGGIDAAAAVALAKTTTASSLGTFVETNWLGSGAVSLPIADNSIAGASSTISETSNLQIEAVRIRIDVTHPSAGDLGVELISPSGTRSVLFTIRGGFSSSDDLKMELMSNMFYDENSTGTWTLKVVDGKTPDGGTLNEWSIKIYGH
jgi:subtilisin family serine protease